VVKLDDIPGLFHDRDAVSAILFYNRWKIMGFPHGPWGDNPNRLVEVVDLLDPLDKIYHPRSVI
jgi:hypothetical protein